MKFVVFQCKNILCEATFAVDIDTVMFGEIECPGCGETDLQEREQMLIADVKDVYAHE